MSKINTIEEETNYIKHVWDKIDLSEKIIIITIIFLYFYVIIVILSSYDKLTKSSEPEIGKMIFWLTVITAAINILPVILHYLGISTYGVIHIFGLISVFTFVIALWLIFEYFDKRELDMDYYKDPYMMSLYFLLIGFSVSYVIGSVSRKL